MHRSTSRRHRTSRIPFRGCGHPIPGPRLGHRPGPARPRLPRRRQRQRRLRARLLRRLRTLPFYADLARRFTLADRYFVVAARRARSRTGSTCTRPRRSGARSIRPSSTIGGVRTGDTIWDRLRPRGVPARYYYTDLPVLALWGERLFDRISLDRPTTSSDAANGHAAERRDGRSRVRRRRIAPTTTPTATSASAQRFVAVRLPGVRAIAALGARPLRRSPTTSGAASSTTSTPPVVPDDRASTVDLENFGQTGFRVPTVLASPFAPARVRRPRRSTTTRRSCASSSGASSAHHPRASTRRTAGGTSPSAIVPRTTSAPRSSPPWIPSSTSISTHRSPSLRTGAASAEGPAVANELGPSDVPPSDRFNDLVTTQFRPAIDRPWQPA